MPFNMYLEQGDLLLYKIFFNQKNVKLKLVFMSNMLERALMVFCRSFVCISIFLVLFLVLVLGALASVAFFTLPFIPLILVYNEGWCSDWFYSYFVIVPLYVYLIWKYLNEKVN